MMKFVIMVKLCHQVGDSNRVRDGCFAIEVMAMRK